VFDCEITELVPAQRLAMTWSWVAETPAPAGVPQAGSVLMISLREVEPGQTELTLVHASLGGAPDEDPAGIAGQWAQALAKLAGQDL
jgi:uncharacterized protein YndB with AHSA1/START domain